MVTALWQAYPFYRFRARGTNRLHSHGSDFRNSQLSCKNPADSCFLDLWCFSSSILSVLEERVANRKQGTARGQWFLYMNDIEWFVMIPCWNPPSVHCGDAPFVRGSARNPPDARAWSPSHFIRDVNLDTSSTFKTRPAKFNPAIFCDRFFQIPNHQKTQLLTF